MASTLDSTLDATPEPPLDLPPDSVRAVLMPALRWDGSRYRAEGTSDPLETLAASGVAGFIVFGGTADAVAELTHRLRGAASRPLLFGADLERGAGQQFAGATPLPPAGALGSIGDPDVTRAAADLTAREARALGIDIVFAPVADVASVPDNPIVGPRAFAAHPEEAARHVRAWVEGALQGGALPCVKHFPGHGRTTTDSHVGEVVVSADSTVVSSELAPFDAAVDAGVPVVMPGHLAVPALDPTGRIATVSPVMLGELLRGDLGFDGVIVSDAMLMAGAGDLATTSVEALLAGMDLLIYPRSVEVAESAVARAAGRDPAVRARLLDATGRLRRLAEDAAARREAGSAEGVAASGVDEGGGVGPDVGRRPDRIRARGWALGAVERVRGRLDPPGPDHAIRVVEVDDDAGGPYPTPSRDPFLSRMQGPGGTRDVDGMEAGRYGAGADRGPGDRGAATVLALWADTRGWKGRAGLSDDAVRELAEALDDASGPTHVVVFGGPRVVADIPDGPTVWLAWGGEAPMQRAAAERLLGSASGSSPDTSSDAGRDSEPGPGHDSRPGPGHDSERDPGHDPEPDPGSAADSSA